MLVRGVRGPDLLGMEKISGTVEDGGGLLDFDNSGGVAIGTGLAQNRSASPSATSSRWSARAAPSRRWAPRRASNPIRSSAIFEIGMSEYDSTYVFMPLAEAQLYFNSPDAAQAIEVYLDDPDQRRRACAPPIEEAAGRPVFSTDWRQRNVTFFTALEVERNVMFLILTLIVLVAALNIISGLIMLVKDKGHDIAILRTMGATKGAILRIFFITGASIGTVGTLAGLAHRHRSSAPTSNRSASSSPGSRAPRSSRRSSTSSRSCRPRWIRARRRRSSLMALALSYPGDALPGLAGGAARSGRGAALRMSDEPPQPPPRAPPPRTGALKARGAEERAGARRASRAPTGPAPARCRC